MRGKFAPSASTKRRKDARRGTAVGDTAGHIAVALATTPEGRAAGLSIEVWPDHDVMLRVRSGHELRIFLESVERSQWVRWERLDPAAHGGRPQTSQGSLGKFYDVGTELLRAFMAQWLACRLRS